jgi:uncharacterized protein YegL
MQSIINFITDRFYTNSREVTHTQSLESGDIPTNFICPLSKKIMVEPVTTMTGHNYDKSSILNYFSNFGEGVLIPSPHDNTIMINKELLSNISLQNEIKEFNNNRTSDVDITYGINYNETKSEVDIVISLKPNTNAKIGKKYICLVLDVSGSMNYAAAEIESGDGEKGFKFTRLDLIKHASKVVSQILTEDDYLSIVTYSTDAKVVMDFTPMDVQGKAFANRVILDLHVDGATYIDRAVNVAFNHCNNSDISNDANCSILLLTDGEPSDNVETIKQSVKNKMLISKNTTLSTFIFGNNANSKLLNNMAETGSGMYSYINDASMIGTVFSNFIANVSNTIINKAKIVVRSTDIHTPLYNTIIDNSQNITITNLHSGCARNILYKKKLQPGTDFKFEFDIITDKSTRSFKITTLENTNLENVCVQNIRHTFIKILSDLIIHASENINQNIWNINHIDSVLDQLISIIKSNILIYPSNVFLLGMLCDLESANPDEGQVKKAFSYQQWYKNWGQHYVLSVIRANWLEETSNYKTPSIAPYASDKFIEIRDKADFVFTSIPPPEPSIKPYNSTTYVQPSAQVYASTFYGGCLDGECPVDVESGKKYISDIKKGDVVIHSRGTSRVKCLVRHDTHNEVTEYAVLCKTSEQSILPLKITKWHPVKTEGIFNGNPTFPNDVVEFTKLSITNYFVSEKPKYVYNIVMEDGDYPWFTVNDFECVALGHKEKVNTVLAHDYYAEKVIDDLKQMDGWENGLVTVSQKKVRDPNTSLVIGLAHDIHKETE